jgi:DNA-binding transcriptional regulator LsrR (DeoR family)
MAGNHPFSSQDDLMVAVAWMYYQDGLTHQEIADQLGLSRVSVTRLLQRARREGVVQVKITRPLPETYRLALDLKRAFGLKEAVVVKTASAAEETLELIGQAGAEHLKETLCRDCRLGFGWSTTVSRMANYLERPARPVQVRVCELAGSMSGHENPYSVSMRVAEMLGAALVSLPVPVLVNSEAAYRALMEEPSIRSALEEAPEVDIAFIGLGDVGPQCTLVRVGALTPEQMDDIRRRGAVGDILMRFYDLEGRYVPTPLEGRTIALKWEQILRIPYTVALAAGPQKTEPILGALRGGFVQGLVTDSETAARVLEKARALAGRPNPPA